MARRTDKLHPDWIERGGDARESRNKSRNAKRAQTGQGRFSADINENTLFYLGRTVDAMSAAWNRGPINNKVASSGYSDSKTPVLSSHGSLSKHGDGLSGLSLPEPCWKRFQKHIRTIANRCGLSVTIKERYIDPLSVVYVKFSRKEK